MPPKPKFTREEVVSAALEIVSKNGLEALTARELGEALGSSARPIFTVFRNMEELQSEVRKAAMHRFEHFPVPLSDDAEMPVFKQIGMRMVLFGLQEPKLYQLLFMQENHAAVSFADVFGVLGQTADTCIHAICSDYHLTQDEARRLFENVWIYTFGVGVLCATGVCRFSPEQLGVMLTTNFKANMLLFRAESKPE